MSNNFRYERDDGGNLILVSENQLGLNTRIYPSLETESGDLNFSGKVIIDPEPLCTREVRIFENNATVDTINDGSGQYVSLKSVDDIKANVEFTLPSTLGIPGTVLTDVLGDGTLSFEVNAGGDVVGPVGSTNNAIVRWDGVTGKLVQDSLGILDDAGILSGLTQLNVDNLRLDGNTLSSIGSDLLIENLPNDLFLTSNIINISAASGVVISTAINHLTFQSTTGKIIIDSGANTPDSILLTTSGSGGIDLDCNGSFIGIAQGQYQIGSALAASNAIRLNSFGAGGGIDMDSVGNTTLSTTAGQIILSSAASIGDAILLNATGVSSQVRINSGDLGLMETSTGIITINSTESSALALSLIAGDASGGILLSSGGGGINHNSGVGLNIIQSNNANPNAVQITANNALGGIELRANVGTRVIGGILLEEAGVGIDTITLGVPVLGASYTLNLPTGIGSANDIMVTDGINQLSFSSSSNLNLVTELSGVVTDNSIARYDGITGKIIQNSALTVDDSGFIYITGNNWIHARGTQHNQFLGVFAGDSNVIGIRNTGIGKNSLFTMVADENNTCLGYNSGFAINGGDRNTLLGSSCGSIFITGNDNICIGYNSAANLTLADSNNILIGNIGVAGINNSIRLGNATNLTCFIEGIRSIVPGASDEMVIIGSTGQLGSIAIPTSDHGSLTGLSDDDHLQYLLVNGSRAMTGSLDMGLFNISGINSLKLVETGAGIDGIIIQAPVSISGDYTLTLPIDNGNSGDLLSSNGSGVLSWIAHALPTGFLYGFQETYSTVSSIIMGAVGIDSACRDSTNTVNIIISGTRTVSLASSGINGLSVTYSETTHTSYDVYVCHDTTGLGLADGYLIIESGDDIELTTEFKTNGDWDTFRRVGWFRNGIDAGDASDIIPFITGGVGGDKEFYFSAEDRTDVLVLDGGTSTTWATVIDTGPVGGDGDRQMSNMTAPNSYFCYLRTAFGDTGSTTAANASSALRPQGNTTTSENTSVWTVSPGNPLGTGEFQDNNIKIPIDPANRTLQYIQSTAGDELYLYVIGFKYSL